MADLISLMIGTETMDCHFLVRVNQPFSFPSHYDDLNGKKHTINGKSVLKLSGETDIVFCVSVGLGWSLSGCLLDSLSTCMWSDLDAIATSEKKMRMTIQKTSPWCPVRKKMTRTHLTTFLGQLNHPRMIDRCHTLGATPVKPLQTLEGKFLFFLILNLT